MKTHKQKPMRFIFDGVMPLVILRPENVELKLASIAKIELGTPHEIAKPLFDTILNEQPHLFVGYASSSDDILDADGKTIGKLQPGDSFASSDEFAPPMFMRKKK